MRVAAAGLVVGMLGLGVGLAQAPAVADLALDVRHRAARPGEVVEITVRAGEPLTGIGATLGDRPVALWRETPTTWRGLVGLDVEQAPGPLVLTAGGTRAGAPPLSRALTLTIEPAAFAERHLAVPPRFVDPPASALPRIAREAERLHAIYDTVSTDRVPGSFAPPVPHRRSSPFGARSIFNGEPRERHSGLDFASPAGAVIHAPAAGRVVLVAPLYFTGNTVVIDHGHGLYSVLAHLRRATVREGQVVLQGAGVGTVGATGRATAPHLHWSVRLGGMRVDPAAVLVLLPESPGHRP